MPSHSRGALPGRSVTAATLEDAYVSFIFYCNPALPPECDSEALREAFRNPPKSGGKTFDTFSIYELVRKFYSKEIKTWTELTIALGVEPPDPSNESAQKLTQYGVRLKKWLNSLRVKSFFEYLMDIPNEYWTKVPDDPDPIGHLVRDGVAVEDDMALRALLPHIRPKRGRKRAEDCETPVSTQRPRLSTPSAMEDLSHHPLAPWFGVGESHFSAHLDVPTSAHPGSGPGAGEEPPTPFARYPNSAITPTNRTGFWDDTREPQSAITPTQPKSARQRRGPKNVSSAWKLGGSDGGAKMRGRPRMIRTPVEAPGYAFQLWNPAKNQPPQRNTSTAAAEHATTQSTEVTEPPAILGPGQPPRHDQPTPTPASGSRHRPPSEAQRPARPNISLQVPQRTGGPVRLATPPPALMVNGQREPQQGDDQTRPETRPANRGYENADEAASPYGTAHRLACDRCFDLNKLVDYYFEGIEDRTNVDALLAFLMRTTQEGEWFDADDNPAEPPSMDEAVALVNSLLQHMLRTSTSTQAFLTNLGSLAGAQALMGSRPRYFRMPDGNGCYNYRFEWEYRFGHLRGSSHMTQSVPRSMWERPARVEDGSVNGAGVGGGALSAEQWKQKYHALLGEMKKRDQELSDLRGKIISSVREDRA